MYFNPCNADSHVKDLYVYAVAACHINRSGMSCTDMKEEAKCVLLVSKEKVNKQIAQTIYSVILYDESLSFYFAQSYLWE